MSRRDGPQAYHTPIVARQSLLGKGSLLFRHTHPSVSSNEISALSVDVNGSWRGRGEWERRREEREGNKG